MQTITDITITVNLTTAVLSAILSAYVIRLWYRQEHRLTTDLPLMFGITFMGQAVNNVLLALPLMGLVDDSIIFFQIRALWIVTTIFPLLGVVINIWLPRYERYHHRILGALAAYWVAVVLLNSSETMIIRLHMPVIIALTIAMIVTFSITWKTGRLQEIRSDLLVLTFALGTVGQGIKALFGLDSVVQIVTAIGTILITVALVNPWYHRRLRSELHDTQSEELIGAYA
ncbi:MAG: hypothetical protein DRP09_00780 [Candidatus Thorarchaeota archaeon]|nr:MAG: hypothetical protein DRP09_00780 [Candidatus Thorarchaeota archaeon]